jgi:hypothetical protein
LQRTPFVLQSGNAFDHFFRDDRLVGHRIASSTLRRLLSAVHEIQIPTPKNASATTNPPSTKCGLMAAIDNTDGQCVPGRNNAGCSGQHRSAQMNVSSAPYSALRPQGHGDVLIICPRSSAIRCGAAVSTRNSSTYSSIDFEEQEPEPF